MKRLFLIAVAMASIVLVNAQTDTSAHKGMKKDCIMMKDGKVWQMKDGNTTEITEDLTMDNGTVVMKDGNVKMKDGKTVMLKEGDCLWPNGKITHKGDMKKKDGAPAGS